MLSYFTHPNISVFRTPYGPNRFGYSPDFLFLLWQRVKGLLEMCSYSKCDVNATDKLIQATWKICEWSALCGGPHAECALNIFSETMTISTMKRKFDSFFVFFMFLVKLLMMQLSTGRIVVPWTIMCTICFVEGDEWLQSTMYCMSGFIVWTLLLLREESSIVRPDFLHFAWADQSDTSHSKQMVQHMHAYQATVTAQKKNLTVKIASTVWQVAREARHELVGYLVWFQFDLLRLSIQ